MSEMKLRTKVPVNYYEPEEPSFDEYIYCDHCRDFVYEYCSLHGPLLIIPDNEVPLRSNFPSFVPRAALTVPSEFLHIAPSIIPGAGLGVFATLTLPRGVRFGPFCGLQTKDISSQYCWMIQDSNTRYKHAIDGSDANASNWMRYVNCARHWHEQNLIAYQYQGRIYYRTIKIVPRYTELMVFYGSEFAATLNIDLRNYNSDNFCQKIASHRLNTGPDIYEELNHIKNFTNEDQNIDMNFEEQVNDTNDNYSTTTIEDFVIIDTPDDSFHSKLNIKQQNDIDPKLEPNDKTCHICQKSYTRRHSLKKHNIRMHANKNETNSNNKDILEDSLDSKSNCIDPKSIKLPEIFPTDINFGINCHICQKSLNSKWRLKKHYIKIHNIDESESRTFLEDSVDSIPNINQKNCISIESGDKQFPKNSLLCHICQKNYTSRSKLKEHYITQHKINKSELNKTVPDLANSKRSKLNCVVKTAFKCDVCDQLFKNRYRLYRHKFTHNEERYICTMCSFKTNHMYVYNNHIRKHTQTEMLYKCDTCSYCSNTKRNIVKHLYRMHK